MLEIVDANVHYDEIQALRKVSTKINKGEFVALIGASGAGKTTLLRTIAGLKRLSSGRMRFKGEDITKLAPEQIAGLGIGHCPQGRYVWRHLTVLENLMLGMPLDHKNKKKVLRDLEKVWTYFPQLRACQRQPAGTLRAVEQQMVVVGQVLMAKPKLLLLDEPFLGLALGATQDLAQSFKQINKDGIALMLAEQDARSAMHLADRAYFVETGTVVREEISGEPAK